MNFILKKIRIFRSSWKINKYWHAKKYQQLKKNYAYLGKQIDHLIKIDYPSPQEYQAIEILEQQVQQKFLDLRQTNKEIYTRLLSIGTILVTISTLTITFGFKQYMQNKVFIIMIVVVIFFMFTLISYHFIKKVRVKKFNISYYDTDVNVYQRYYFKNRLEWKGQDEYINNFNWHMKLDNAQKCCGAISEEIEENISLVRFRNFIISSFLVIFGVEFFLLVLSFLLK